LSRAIIYSRETDFRIASSSRRTRVFSTQLVLYGHPASTLKISNTLLENTGFQLKKKKKIIIEGESSGSIMALLKTSKQKS